MKISVKTLRGNQFDLDVNSADTVLAVKKQIEETQGKDAFPCAQQLLIHQGKVLKDETTMEDNKVSDNGFLVVMLTKAKPQAAAPAPSPAPAPAPPPAVAATPAPAANPAPPPPPSSSQVVPAAAPPAAEAPAAAASPAPASVDAYGHAASLLVAGAGLEQTIQQIIDMGGGSWDRDTVLRALRAAFNNPERAVEYLYSGIPETAEVPPPVARAPTPAPAAAVAADAPAAAPAPAPTGPNSAPLDLFPQGMPGVGGGIGGVGTLDFLRNNTQFQALRSMVQANPQILQPMLQELGKQNPQLLRLINDNQAEFLRLINEAGAEGGEGDPLAQLVGAMPQAINVTPEEREAIDRLEAMGFDRALVIEAFLACDKNEQLAANYLLEHSGDYDD